MMIGAPSSVSQLGEGQGNDDDDYNFEVDPSSFPVHSVDTITASSSITPSSRKNTLSRNDFIDDTSCAQDTASYYRANASRVGRGGGGASIISSSYGDVRPMTAVSGAGYRSNKRSGNHYRSSEQIGQSMTNIGRTPASSECTTTKSHEAIAKDMQKEIHRCIEESAQLVTKNEPFPALDKAKEAVKKDRTRLNYLRSKSLPVQQYSRDLSFAAWFQLASMYDSNGLHIEAIETYSSLLKQKKFPACVGRIRVNMGDIYYRQGKFSSAIKMYRMALDQTPMDERGTSVKIYRCIGNSFVKMGKMKDAIQNYETAMTSSPDVKSCFNLLLCYVIIGDVDKSTQSLVKMASIVSKLSDPVVDLLLSQTTPKNSEEEKEERQIMVMANEFNLEQDLDERKKKAHSLLYNGARLVSSLHIDNTHWVEGFRRVYDLLKDTFCEVAFQIEIDQAIHHLMRSEFVEAIKILKSYETKQMDIKAKAAINLCFVYFHEGNYATANEYAEIALASNRYNPNALVNKGNILFIQDEFVKAKDLYLEAVGIQSNCVEAIYNLGLVNVRIGRSGEALQAFEKLHTIIPNDPRVLYQVANIHEQQGDDHQATKWFNILSARVPTEPGVLSRLSQLLSSHEKDKSQSFHYQMESYRHYPSNLDVIGWIAVWFLKHEMYERSIHFFRCAAEIQPQEVKWRLMVASCYRRVGNGKRAFDLYEKIRCDHPENLECLKYLIALCKGMGKPFVEYEDELKRRTKSIGASGGIHSLSPPAVEIRAKSEKSTPHFNETRGTSAAVGMDTNALSPITSQEKYAISQPSTSSTHVDGGGFDDEDVTELLV